MIREEEHLKLNEKKWDRWSGLIDSDGWKFKILRQAQQSVISLLDIKEGIHFLDVGCGTGWAVGQVIKRVDGKGSFYGVDLSQKMIEKAKENFKETRNIHFIKANAESIPLEDNYFNVIICTNSFHHYLNPGKALKEFYRLLKQYGKVYILDPAADTWIMKAIDKIVGRLEPEHVKLYSTKEFKNLFIAAGLKYSGTEILKYHQKIHVGIK